VGFALRLNEILEESISFGLRKEQGVEHTAQASHDLAGHRQAMPPHRCDRPRPQAAFRSMRGLTMLRRVRAGTGLRATWTSHRRVLWGNILHIL
jgi:hypothetical protein